MFNVLIHKKALKELNDFPEEDRTRIRSAIKDIATNPFGGDVIPIKGTRGVLRLRVGDYRIAFAVNF